MKKGFSIIACITLLVSMLTGCSKTPEEVIITTQSTEYSVDVEVITCDVVVNTDEEEYCLGRPYELQIKENGEFKAVEYKSDEVYFESDARILPKGPATTTYTVNIKPYYNLPLKKGTYRIKLKENELITNEFTVK